MDHLRLGKFTLSLGGWKFWIGLSYFAALIAALGPNLGFLTRAVFGAVVSPIFEEYMIRAPLRKWFGASYFKLISMSVLSSALFSLMHWFYLPDFGVGMSGPDHIQKFFAHFTFGIVLALIYIVTKRIKIPVVLHILSNLQWVPRG